MRLRSFLVAAAFLAGSFVAKADSFNFTLTGSAGGFSGSGVFTGSQVGNTGSFLITGVTGTGINGLIPVGGYLGNDNLLFPSSSTLVDPSGIAFYEQNPSGVYQVNLHSTNGAYFVTVNEINTTTPFTVTLPVNFTASTVTPEPSSLLLLGTGTLGVLGAARRRLFA